MWLENEEILQPFTEVYPVLSSLLLQGGSIAGECNKIPLNCRRDRLDS